MISRTQFVRAGVLAALTGCRPAQRTTIAAIPKATSHLFFVSIRAGVDKAAEESDVSVLWNGPSEETDHGRQIEIVDSMIARRVDGIAISATDERALAGSVQKAIDQGIPVVVFDSGVNVDGYVSFIATDNLAAGRVAARSLAALVGIDGTIGMVMHKPGGTSTLLREQGFEETLKQEFPGIRVVARQFGLADEARSLAATENILSAHPDLAGLFASSEASSIGAIRALNARKLGGKVRLVTFDTSKSHVEALRAGVIDVMLVQDAFRIGYEAVRALTGKLRGETPPVRLDLPARRIVKADLQNPDVQRLLAGSG